MYLKLYQEIVGTLAEIKLEQNQTKLIFSLYKKIEIPVGAIPNAELEAAVGKRVGIFYSGTDGYRIREIKG
jgi:hypothetical protein